MLPPLRVLPQGTWLVIDGTAAAAAACVSSKACAAAAAAAAAACFRASA